MTHHTTPHRRRPGARGLTAVIAAFMLALSVAACGDDDAGTATAASGTTSTSSSSSSSGSSDSGGIAAAQANLDKYTAPPTDITITEPLEGTPPTGKSLVMLGTNDPNNVKLQESLKSLSEEYGWTYSTVDYDPANPATFKAAVNTALQKDPDYIAEAGIPLTADVIQQVKDAGAKWVLTSVHPVALDETVIVNANAYANDELMGKVLADFFITDSEGKGNIIIEHVPAYPILEGFTDGFQAEVKANCPDCKVQIQDITIPDLTAGKVPTVMTSALRKNPAADYVGFDVGPFATGIDAALASAGLSDKVKVIGEAADEGAIAALKSGKHTAWTGFDPVYSTYVMMDAMFRDSLGQSIDTEAAGLQTTQLLTKDNVGDITTWAEPGDALDQFKQLWGQSS